PFLNLVPALAYLFGQVPAAARGPAVEGARWAHIRLMAVLEAFAAVRRPLILFLDDLQWLDVASHGFLRYLAHNGLVPGLLLVMAFRSRDAETSAALEQTTALYQQQQATLPLALNGLNKRDTRALLKVRLNTNQDLTPLADICHGKTSGNPFYLIQLLDELLETEVIARNNGEWMYDIAHIAGLAFTENVIDLLIERMRLLEDDCLALLRQAACIRGDMGVPLLKATSGFPREKIQTLLWKPIQLDLLHQTQKGFRFAHDRIPESLEAQLGDDEARAIHRRLVAFFLADERRADLEANLFTLLHHYECYAHTITDGSVKKEMARLYFMAGEQARGRSAYTLALAYFTRGKVHFPGDIWAKDYELALGFCRQMAECAYLAGDFAAADRMFAEAQARVPSFADRVTVEMVKIPCFQAQEKEKMALAAGLNILRGLGFRIPENPSNRTILYAILKAWIRYVLSRKERLIGQRMTPDTAVYRAVKCIGALGSVMFRLSPQKLLPLLTAISFNLTLKYGNMAETPVTFMVFGMILDQMTGSVKWGRTLGGMAREISRHFDDARLKTKEKTMIAVLLDHWDKPLAQAIRDFESAEAFCLRHGDHEYYAYNALGRLHGLLISSSPFGRVLQSINETKKVFERINNRLALTTVSILQQAVDNLDQGVREPWVFTGDHFNEARMDNRNSGIFTELYIYKFYVAVYCGRMDIAAGIRENLVTCDEMAIDAYQYNYFLFLGALVDIHLNSDGKKIRRHLKRLKKHAACNEALYGNKYLLALGDSLRLKGDSKAAAVYREAATAADTHGFRFEQALSLEGLGKIAQESGDGAAAEAYFKQAIRLYKEWGLEWKQGLFDDTTQGRHAPEAFAAHPHAPVPDRAKGRSGTAGHGGEPGMVNGVEDILRAMKGMSGATVIHAAVQQVHCWKSHVYIDDSGIHRPAICVPLPEKMLSFACAAGEVIHADAESCEERFFDTAYYLSRSPSSLLVIPGKERNGIYLENADADTSQDMAALTRLAEQVLAHVRPDPSASTPEEDPGAVGTQLRRKQCRILQEHMTTRKAYRNQSLSLAGLAKEVGMPQRVVTDAINTCLGQNFKTFVNSYRIEAVKQALGDPVNKDKTILEIAYAQGFNAKSTFNEVFKESIGTTPSKFRADLLGR
ncbi:MAG: helix-turn-helix domain-containing protein, partial [Desulfobacteraceae bacterium]